MARQIGDRLLDGAVVESCQPGKCLYLGAEGCSVRYDVAVRLASGSTQDVLVLGRVHGDATSASAYRRSLEGPRQALASRGVDAPVASLPDGIVLHPFPVDADLPTLVGATDPERIAPLLADAGVPFERCSPVLGHYGRRHRCVLRYEVDGLTVAYGKVCADHVRGEVAGRVLRALQGRVEGVSLPPFLAHAADLHLTLLGVLPGRPALAGELADGGRPVPLVAAAAAAAAALHRSGVELGAPRSMQDELDELDGLLALMEPISSQLAAALRTRLDAVTAAAGATEPMPCALVHGDFTPSQLLRDGDRCGLVDFDGVAQAEPALDLGQYVAYLRLAAAKAGAAAAADGLVDGFVAAYAAGTDLDAVALRARVQVYACVSLLRTTVHAWQKLKPKRVGTVLPILLEEAACLPIAPR
jgi:hypothetical protein